MKAIESEPVRTLPSQVSVALRLGQFQIRQIGPREPIPGLGTLKVYGHGADEGVKTLNRRTFGMSPTQQIRMMTRSIQDMTVLHIFIRVQTKQNDESDCKRQIYDGKGKE